MSLDNGRFRKLRPRYRKGLKLLIWRDNLTGRRVAIHQLIHSACA